MQTKRERSKQILLGGLSIIAGFPFLAAGASAALLQGKLVKGVPAAAAILFLCWYISGFQGAAITAVCAAVASISARSRYTLLKTIYLCSGSALLTGGLLSLGYTGFMNIGETELEPVREAYLSAGLESGTIDQVFSLLTYFSPGIGAIHIVLGSMIAVLFFNSLVRSSAIVGAGENTRFRMHWAIAWIPIICLITLVSSRNAAIPSSAMRIAGNLLVFIAFAYGLEGLQVAVKWAKRIPGMVFMLAFSAIFAPPLILGGLILLGILDTWFDYRKKIDIRIERNKNEGSSDQNS
jgi:hypothetical protein